MVLDGLARQEQALGQLMVRQALGEQAEDLALALREDVDVARAGATGRRAQRAQQRRGGVGIARGAEPFE